MATNKKQRRQLIARLGTTAAAVALGGGAAAAQTPARSFQPIRHEQDNWLDEIPGRHRLILDTTTPDGFGDALAFLNNYFNVNGNAYGLKDEDLAVVLVARHLSTLFAYTDAVWAKYGTQITARTNFNDPKTKQPPKINLFNAPDYGPALTNRGTTLDALLKRGLRVAVCQTATRNNATAFATATGQTADAVFNELAASLISRSARLVPAGIITVNNAQERGYSLVRA